MVKKKSKIIVILLVLCMLCSRTINSNAEENKYEEKTTLSGNEIIKNEMIANENESKNATNSVSENSYTQNTNSENKASENSVSENDISQNSISQNSISQNSISQNSISQNSISQNSISQNSISQNSMSTEYSGKCGEAVSYEFDKNTGLLKLSGAGALFSYTTIAELPWSSYYDKILKIQIGNEIKGKLWYFVKKYYKEMSL